MKINKIDVFWNYIATFFKIATSIILLPLILRFLPAQEVAIWTIFSAISGLIFLLDFGFHSSFIRNISYVFSGVQFLEKEGISENLKFSTDINYALLKGVLNAMKWFYTRISIALFIILLCFGSIYLNIILKSFNGEQSNIWIAWILFCLINTYNLYTLYYESLMEGRGLIRVSKKITILGNIFYLIVATVLVLNNFGIIAIVISQVFSVITIRFFSYRFFFDKELLLNLKKVDALPFKQIIEIIFPNAYKYGVTSLGGFMIQKASIFVGSIYLPLGVIASFGITKQILDVIIAMANITLVTYLPKIMQLRIERNSQMIKQIYIKGIIFSNLFFIFGVLCFMFLGPSFLSFIDTKTLLVPFDILIVMSVSALIGLNAGISGSILATNNIIPFMKPSIYSGIGTVILLLFFFRFTNFGLFGLALAPGLIDLCYQGWKWPYEVFKDLDIRIKDVKTTICEFLT